MAVVISKLCEHCSRLGPTPRRVLNLGFNAWGLMPGVCIVTFPITAALKLCVSEVLWDRSWGLEPLLTGPGSQLRTPGAGLPSS